MVRLGGWLFKHRTWLPVPLALAVLLTPQPQTWSPLRLAAGIVLVAGGELLRLWGVHHIGVISRTRGERIGPLIDTGPFAYTRNPLYVGNIALWIGFACCAQLTWLAPLLLLVLGLEYHAIVLWEEALLASKLGPAYVAYTRQVGRWMPTLASASSRRAPASTTAAAAPLRGAFSWRDTLFSERGTLIAIGAASALLWIKARF